LPRNLFGDQFLNGTDKGIARHDDPPSGRAIDAILRSGRAATS
jgi:hypothetical protein